MQICTGDFSDAGTDPAPARGAGGLARDRPGPRRATCTGTAAGARGRAHGAASDRTQAGPSESDAVTRSLQVQSTVTELSQCDSH